ncbi:NAD(P)H-dependent oxidoreductase [Aestuariibacter sp. GS-14]|uniref:NADPH-dependent FMN reductase n=1 Tax=Alteromonadaceae TaxID=72275 RepID=UPI00112C5D43|nr:NAD(P)H-dependent oxidoreductase [Aestuariibacter sp. GS-14]TPV61842.1 NAD(P)H-dependent oxidoreductase [Aestuariibacter sp. GS-14]
MTRILAFSGSTRRNSYNQAVVECAAQAARDAGADVTVINLADYAMPIFNEDEEAEFGIPERAQAFKQLMIDHDGILIASPEYNSSYPAVLKNAIDWASRKTGDEAVLAAYKQKVVGLMAASPGALGGMRVLVVLRMLMQNLSCIVAPAQVAVGNVADKVDESGAISDEKTKKQLAGLAKQVVELATKLKSA